MDVTALLCNHAEALNNLLYISGGGIEQTMVPAGAPGPFGVNLALGITVSIPWTQTNQQHLLKVELVDSDGRPVEVPTGPEATTPFLVQMAFNVGRPPGLTPGRAQSVALAVNLPGLPIPGLGDYVFVLKIADVEVARLTYSVIAQQQNFTFGPGPGQVPRLQ